jgi:uncharacterized RDD family membrane protein YckC
MGSGAMGSDRVWRPAAALPRRVLAGIHTGSRVLLIVVPFKLLVYGFVRIGHSPSSIRTFADLGGLTASLRFWALIFYIVIALAVLYAFLVRPVLQGATWGQERFGIAVEDPDGDTPGWRPATVRFLVHLGFTVLWPLGLIYLVWSLRQDEPLDLTDRWSGTRQFEEDVEVAPLRQAIGQAFFPGALAIVLLLAVIGPLSVWMMAGYQDLHLVEQVTPTLTPEEANAAKVESVLKAQEEAMRQ